MDKLPEELLAEARKIVGPFVGACVEYEAAQIIARALHARDNRA